MRLNERCVAEFSTSSAPTDKEGFLNKKGELNRGYQRRWFILKGNLLFYFEKRSDKEPIGVVVLDNCHVELAESGEPYAFQITFGGDGSRTYILGADTPKEMESWMRAITHSSYEYLKMMVESFESTLEKLTSEENDLVTAGSSDNTNATSSVSGASNFNTVDTEEDRSNSESFFQIPVASVTDDFGSGNTDRLDNLELPTRQGASAYSGDVDINDLTLDRTETPVGNLINLDDDDDDDDQIPIQNEFSFDEGFYSFPKHSSELMPLSYSDLERLEVMHNEDLFSRLSGNTGMPSRSKDDFDMITRVKREAVSRSQRPKSERRRRINAHTMYENVETQPSLRQGKPHSLPRSLTLTDEGGYLSEHTSVFRYLHELYSASIWVKCREFWRQDNLKS